LVAQDRRRCWAALAILFAAACGAAPPPPPVAEPRVARGPAGDPERILAAIVARDREALTDLAATHRVRSCGTSGQVYVDCAATLLGAAARAPGLDAATKSLYETFARAGSWAAGPTAARVLAEAMESPGPASLAADALLVARGNIVLDALDAAAERDRALLFAMGIGLPCPDVLGDLGHVPPQRRRAALIGAGCIAAGDDTLTESPDGLAARVALEALDGARRHVRSAGGALADALLSSEPAFRAIRIPIPLATSLRVRGSTLTLPEATGALDWSPPVAILTIVGEGIHIGEPPWLGIGPRGASRLGTVLPGPRTTAEALGDDLVQVLAAQPPSWSGEAASGPVLVVADARESAVRVGAVLNRLAALPDAPRVAIAVDARGQQAQVDVVDTHEPETPVALRLVLGAHSAMVVASGIGLPADRDLVSLGRRLDEVRATFPAEHAITLVLGGDVTVARLVEVLELTQASRRFPVVRIAAQ
jgi:hypothetical protein